MTSISSWLARTALLLALLLPGSAFPPPAPAAPWVPGRPPDGQPFGLNSHLATRFPDPARMGLPADVVATLGVRWVREDFQWHRIQPTPDHWDWLFFDRAVAELRARDIMIVGVLGPAVGWATPFSGDEASDVSFYAPDPAQYARFAAAVAARYRGLVSHWEIWNEPDHRHFWLPHPDPAAYAELLTGAAAAIRAVAPEAHILVGGTNPFDTRFLEVVAQAGAWDSFDILAIHPYLDPLSPEAGAAERVTDLVQPLLRRYGARPIWATEVGWASGPGDRDSGHTDARAQADYLVRGMLLLWLGGIERSFWYTLKDDAHNPYGLIAYGTGRDDFDPTLHKPAYFALRMLIQQTSGSIPEQLSVYAARSVITGFEPFGIWYRGDEPFGTLTATTTPRRSGHTAARLGYAFPPVSGAYLPFFTVPAMRLPDETSAVELWVYGDGQSQALKLWLRDATGEILQLPLGVAGAPGWRRLYAPLPDEFPAYNRLSPGGDGRPDPPLHITAILLVPQPARAVGSGRIYLDDLTALYGPISYQLQLRQGRQLISVSWAQDDAPLWQRE